MTTRVQCGVSAGLAIVGASVLAVAPLTLPMPSQAAPVTAEIELTATPLEQAAILVQGFADSGFRAGSSAALTPLSPVLAGAALAYGDEDRAYSVIRQSLDAPLWTADPTIDAFATVLPRELGGGTDGVHESDNGTDGALINFRDDVLWATTNAVRTQIRDAIGADDSQVNQNYAAVVGAGLLASGERFVTSAAGAPLGLIPIAQAIASGSEEELYIAIRQYIDAPLYIADPTIDALAVALPQPLGGTDLNHETPSPADGQLAQFRDNVLWRTTAAVRAPIANVLGVDPNLDKDNLPSASNVTNTQAFGATNVAKTGASSNAAVLTGSGKGAGTTTGSTATHRPISTAVKAINNQLKESADRLDGTVKKITGTGQKTTSSNTDAATN
ncbi:hypothetical protein [Mycobacterium sp. ITM-2016-00318]|uniref:hypothetical protein n=1 Tax=Mycobacterium sp. ITM-2016-00318 TaxID=2099693 RepID=UPI001158FB3E|nr:hypothetical protein [Mycobacterium sp. ITM-2016-00318]WNG91773.1 hypothetical protein C6A82_020250 [Mycobacterium sp. ITM-2016-00318]